MILLCSTTLTLLLKVDISRFKLSSGHRGKASNFVVSLHSDSLTIYIAFTANNLSASITSISSGKCHIPIFYLRETSLETNPLIC